MEEGLQLLLLLYLGDDELGAIGHVIMTNVSIVERKETRPWQLETLFDLIRGISIGLKVTKTGAGFDG